MAGQQCFPPPQCCAPPAMLQSCAPSGGGPVGQPTFQVQPCPPCPGMCPPPECQPCCVKVIPPECAPPPKIIKKRRYIQPARPKSYKPDQPYSPPCLPMEDNTIYRKSYLPVEQKDRPMQVIPPNNICVGTGKMSGDTIHTMSYQPVKVAPPQLIIPCEHKLLGDGPMQDVTTHRHDYVPKPFSKPEIIKNTSCLYSSDCPMSDLTTNRLSYMPVDLSQVYTPPIKPLNSIEPPQGKFSDKTIHNMSYLNWEAQKPVDKPWADRPKYCPPKLKMDDNTVHKMSYGPPGSFIDCPDNDDSPDCIPYECPVPQMQTPICPPPVCPLPCCCPKASC